MNYFKKLAGQTAVYGLSNIVGRLLSYLLVPLYTRIFEPEVYGVVTEFYSYIAFALIFYTYGMETAFFHFSEKKKDNDKVFGTGFFSILSTSTLLSALLW
ncbi:MAG: oligosaccharide flippase family protein, partial [Bacteroidia bacterium]|nr:oligosaccharide flippase family protein [Bacteroidia bacterium]